MHKQSSNTDIHKHLRSLINSTISDVCITKQLSAMQSTRTTTVAARLQYQGGPIDAFYSGYNYMHPTKHLRY